MVYFCQIMNVFRDIETLPEFRNAIVTIGSFDGVHRGHQRILRRIRRLAAEHDGESVVITFDKHPRQVLSPWDTTLQLLTTTGEKLQYLEESGVDNVILVPFTVEFSQMGPSEYIERFLIGKVHPRLLVVGYDHRFGRDRRGNFHLLETYAKQGYFDLVQIPKQEIDHIDVSSTKIREALLKGDIDQGNKLLNHPYRITGKVVRGRKIGRSLGYPTANIELPDPVKLIPAAGVYAAFAHIDRETFSAMLYIGTRPTFHGTQDTKVSIEVHVLDFSREIYDVQIEIDLIRYIRSDMAMSGAEALRAQIHHDETQIRACLANFMRARQIPDVAIVALNYNGRAMLERYLPTFLDVAYPKLDIIVADNGSTDDSITYIEEQFPEIQVIRLGQNYGYAEGYNRALANLDHEYYALVNTDVALTPHWLSRMITVMDSDRRFAACQPKILSDSHRDQFEYAGACGGFIDIFGYAFCAGRILHTLEKDVGQYDNLHTVMWASGAALVVKSDIFHAAGGFDGSYFAHQEEIDLCWTIQRLGYRVGVVPEACVYHLGGATLEYDTPAKVFLNFRNNLTTISKQMFLLWLLPVLLMRCFLDLSASLHFVLRGQAGNALAVIKAYGAFWWRFPGSIRKRRRIAKLVRTKHIGPSQVRLYKGSILADYYILGKRVFTQLSERAHAALQGSRNPLS